MLKRPFVNGHQKTSKSSLYFEKSLKISYNVTYEHTFSSHARVLFTQRDANFDSIDQQANKQLLTPCNQSAQSSPQQVKSGVPQRSLLGPILFSIYINDLPNCLLQSKILLYVDDAVLFYADPIIGNISTVLNKDLKQLQSWTHLNKLCIHPV